MVLPEHSKVLHSLILTLLAATTIELKASYDAKNSAPTTAAPKIFFKWFYINTNTGEKSGEIMGYCKLHRVESYLNLTMKRLLVPQ